MAPFIFSWVPITGAARMGTDMRLIEHVELGRWIAHIMQGAQYQPVQRERLNVGSEARTCAVASMPGTRLHRQPRYRRDRHDMIR